MDFVGISPPLWARLALEAVRFAAEPENQQLFAAGCYATRLSSVQYLLLCNPGV